MLLPSTPTAVPSRQLSPAPLSEEEEGLLAQRLGEWRRHPLSPEHIADLLPRISDPSLALALGERLGMAGPTTITLLLPLCRQQGITQPLIRALSLCHHPRARDQLLAWLPQAGESGPAVLEALACWGNQIDLAIIEQALQAPGRAFRLAGLELLTFRNRSLPAHHLLELTAPLLKDLRAEVVIATLRLLQRRSEVTVLSAIGSCIELDALPGVAEMAIQCLGCIGTEESCQQLLAQADRLFNTRLEQPLRRQLEAQVPYKHLVIQTLEVLNSSFPSQSSQVDGM